MDASADTIQRELILPAPPERVWAALTQPDALSAWFGTHASVDLRPGGQIDFTWDDPATGDHSTNGGVIEVVDAPRRFAFRWRPYAPPEQAERVPGSPHASSSPSTRTPMGHGCGWWSPVSRTAARLVEHRARRQRDRWTRELGELREYIAAART